MDRVCGGETGHATPGGPDEDFVVYVWWTHLVEPGGWDTGRVRSKGAGDDTEGPTTVPSADEATADEAVSVKTVGPGRATGVTPPGPTRRGPSAGPTHSSTSRPRPPRTASVLTVVGAPFWWTPAPLRTRAPGPYRPVLRGWVEPRLERRPAQSRRMNAGLSYLNSMRCL